MTSFLEIMTYVVKMTSYVVIMPSYVVIGTSYVVIATSNKFPEDIYDSSRKRNVNLKKITAKIRVRNTTDTHKLVNKYHHPSSSWYFH